MRINKKYVGTKKEYVNISFRGAAEGLSWMMGLFFIGYASFALVTWLDTSPAEAQRIQTRCNIVAGNHAHFTRDDGNGGYDCVVGPSWTQVQI